MSSPSNEKILNTLLTLFNETPLQPSSPHVIDTLQQLITENIQNPKSLTFIFQQIQNQLLNLKGPQKKAIITLIPHIIKTNPKHLLPFTDKIISLYQTSITEDTSKLFTFISKNFGETSKIIINANHTSNYLLNSTLDNNDTFLSNELTNIYNQLKQFCMNNIKNHNRYNQICGTLCLTAFIENCAYNYTNKDNLKSIWETLIYQITNTNFYAKLELLNCLISLIFSSEERFKPFASMTLYKIFDYITDEDWLKRKLALNIVYTLVYYCGDEIKPLKSYISKFLSERSVDQVEEVRDVCLQIIKLLGDSNSNNNSGYNGNDSGWYSERSTLSNRSSQKKMGLINKTNSKMNANMHYAVKHNRKKSDGGGYYYGTNMYKNKSTIETIRENFTTSSSSSLNHVHRDSNTNRGRSSSAKRSSRKYYSIHNNNNNNNSSHNTLNINHSVNNITKSAQKERNTFHHIVPSSLSTNTSCITERTSSMPKIKQQPFLSSKPTKHTSLSKRSYHSSSNITNTSSSSYNTITAASSKKHKANIKPHDFSQRNSLNKPDIYEDIIKTQDDQGRLIVQLQTHIKEIEHKYKDSHQLKLYQLKKELKDYLKCYNYEEAFKCVVEINSVKKMEYVIKCFIVNYKDDDNDIISKDTLKELMNIFVCNILRCNNIAVMGCFFKDNIINKKYTFDNEFHIMVINEVNKVLIKKEKLMLSKKEIEYLNIIVNYFKQHNI